MGWAQELKDFTNGYTKAKHEKILGLAYQKYMDQQKAIAGANPTGDLDLRNVLAGGGDATTQASTGNPSPGSVPGAAPAATLDAPVTNSAIPGATVPHPMGQGGAGSDYAAPTHGGGGDYFSRIAHVESGSKDMAAHNPSGATGRYQFIPSTWSGMIRNHPELNLTPGGIHDSDQQERAIRAFTADNASMLKNANLPVTPQNLYVMHFAGPTGLKLLRADPNAPASSVFGAPQVAANRSILSGSVGHALNYLQGVMSGTAPYSADGTPAPAAAPPRPRPAVPITTASAAPMGVPAMPPTPDVVKAAASAQATPAAIPAAAPGTDAGTTPAVPLPTARPANADLGLAGDFGTAPAAPQQVSKADDDEDDTPVQSAAGGGLIMDPEQLSAEPATYASDDGTGGATPQAINLSPGMASAPAEDDGGDLYAQDRQDAYERQVMGADDDGDDVTPAINLAGGSAPGPGSISGQAAMQNPITASPGIPRTPDGDVDHKSLLSVPGAWEGLKAGLSHLVGAFGLGSEPGAVPGATSSNQQGHDAFHANVGAMSDDAYNHVVNTVDPTGQLSANQRSLASLNALRQWYMVHDPAKAGPVLAAFAQKAKEQTMLAGQIALAYHAQGDHANAAQAVAHGSNFMPNGTGHSFDGMTPDGKVKYTAFDESGNITHQGEEVMDQVMKAATGMANGSQFLLSAGQLQKKSAAMLRLEAREKAQQQDQDSLAALPTSNSALAAQFGLDPSNIPSPTAGFTPDQQAAYNRLSPAAKKAHDAEFYKGQASIQAQQKAAAGEARQASMDADRQQRQARADRNEDRADQRSQAAQDKTDKATAAQDDFATLQNNIAGYGKPVGGADDLSADDRKLFNGLPAALQFQQKTQWASAARDAATAAQRAQAESDKQAKDQASAAALQAQGDLTAKAVAWKQANESPDMTSLDPDIRDAAVKAANSARDDMLGAMSGVKNAQGILKGAGFLVSGKGKGASLGTTAPTSAVDLTGAGSGSLAGGGGDDEVNPGAAGASGAMRANAAFDSAYKDSVYKTNVAARDQYKALGADSQGNLPATAPVDVQAKVAALKQAHAQVLSQHLSENAYQKQATALAPKQPNYDQMTGVNGSKGFDGVLGDALNAEHSQPSPNTPGTTDGKPYTPPPLTHQQQYLGKQLMEQLMHGNAMRPEVAAQFAESAFAPGAFNDAFVVNDGTGRVKLSRGAPPIYVGNDVRDTIQRMQEIATKAGASSSAVPGATAPGKMTPSDARRQQAADIADAAARQAHDLQVQRQQAALQANAGAQEDVLRKAVPDWDSTYAGSARNAAGGYDTDYLNRAREGLVRDSIDEDRNNLVDATP